MEEAIYHEEQKPRQWFIVGAIGLSVIVTLFMGIRILMVREFESLSVQYLVGTSLILLAIAEVILFSKFKMTSEVCSDMIRVKFTYLFLRWKEIKFDEIESYEINKYSPIREYGGWGIRYSPLMKKKAYNISGNMGIKLKLKDGWTLLIGTQRPEEFKNALDINWKTN
jgi:hypothetical protein